MKKFILTALIGFLLTSSSFAKTSPVRSATLLVVDNEVVLTGVVLPFRLVETTDFKIHMISKIHGCPVENPCEGFNPYYSATYDQVYVELQFHYDDWIGSAPYHEVVLGGVYNHQVKTKKIKAYYYENGDDSGYLVEVTSYL